MTRCNGRTKSGNRCRANVTNNGYCRWHNNIDVPQTNPDCAVCYEPCNEFALPCGHWVHRICVQKGADALQEIRATEGYPPIEVCSCPVCRTSVPGMKPTEAPPVPSFNVNVDVTLDYSEMNVAFQDWVQSDRTAPLSWYIWTILSEKYPNEDSESIITIADAFEQMIGMGLINPRSLQLDQRFAQVLSRWW
jgi:hypothetical protein